MDEQENRRLAEWIEPKPTNLDMRDSVNAESLGFKVISDPQENGMFRWHSPLRAWMRHDDEWQPRDFYRDESANAQIVDKLAKGNHLDVVRYGPEETEIALYVIGKDGADELKPKHGYERILVADVDRRTAWCKAAFIAFKERG